MKTITTTKIIKSTWLDRKATSTVHQLEKSRDGLRIVVMQFDDEEKATVSLMEGNGMKNGFVLHKEYKVDKSLVDYTVQEILDAA